MANNNNPDKDLNNPGKDLSELGFETSKSKRSLIYIILGTLISVIVLLARQVSIERKATKAAEDKGLQIQETLYKEMVKIIMQELKEPKSKIEEAVNKVDTAAAKVKDVAEKLDGRNKR